MDIHEMLPVPMNDWFFTQGELTDLGYAAIEFAPNTDQVWELMNLTDCSENLQEFLKKCMEFAILDDATLNFLFPTIGSTVFRLAIENTMAVFCYWPGVDDMVYDIEMALKIQGPDEPFIFYTET
ncbi:MAG: hypothetical protein WCG44_04685 [bacterium]